MIRSVLFHVIPLILPFVVYAVYLYFNKRAGGDKTWRGKSIAVLTVVGLMLMALSLLILGAVSGEPREGTVYVPPKFIDGKLIDSEVIPAEKNN